MGRYLQASMRLAGVVAGSLFVWAAAAQGKAPAAAEANEANDVAPGKVETCLRLSQIESTEVLDDRTIIFHMKSGTPRMYKNSLPHKCHGLGFQKSYSYKTSINQICSIDIITVLENYAGGLQPGASCGLGKFVPYQRPPKAKK